MGKILTRDINGNYVYVDVSTGQSSVSDVPQSGTIQANTVRSIGGDRQTKKGRYQIARNQTNNYNNRQHKVHNYADQTIRLNQKQQTVSVDNEGEPVINQTDYTPNVEAPMEPYTPVEEFVIGNKVFELPFLLGKGLLQAANKVSRFFKPKLLTEHVQGNEAIKMFKEYGGESIPEGSINGEQLRKYVIEARERYGLVGNENITDEEIAQALYKHSKELGGNTAAVNAQGEPQLLFRGDTRRYTQLKERESPEELAQISGTMDNSLGNLFLGELPGTAGKTSGGLERYLVTGRDFRGWNKWLEGSGTGARVKLPDGTVGSRIDDIATFPEGSYPLVAYNTRFGENAFYKLPRTYSESGVNDINGFVVRTPEVRDASREISVLNDDFLIKGGSKVDYHGPVGATNERQAMAQHYRYVLNDAKNKKQGLLKSKGETDGNPGNYLREEHSDHTYFALPNFNIGNAKHILPYDLRIPRNWNDKNIYRALIPVTGGGYLYSAGFNKRGGKMHIKKENKGKFTEYCNGKITNECISKGKHSSNPVIRKRAIFAENARHFKHKSGGIIKAQQGTNFTTKVGNFMNSGWGQLAQNAISGITSAIAKNKEAAANAEKQKADNEATTNEAIAEATKKIQEKQNQNYQKWVSDYIQGLTLDNPSDIVSRHQAYQGLGDEIAKQKQALANKNAQVDTELAKEQSSNIGDIFSNLGNSAKDILGNMLNNKTSTNLPVNYSTSQTSNGLKINTTVGNVTTSNTYNIPKAPTVELPKLKTNMPTYNIKS